MVDEDMKYDLHNSVCVFSSLELQYDLDILLEIYKTAEGKYFAIVDIPFLYDDTVRVVDLPLSISIS